MCFKNAIGRPQFKDEQSVSTEWINSVRVLLILVSPILFWVAGEFLVARVTRVFQLAVLIFALISALRKQVSCSVFRRSLFESDFFPNF